MIKLICGAMYSGKSTSLLREMEKFLYAKKKILFIRPMIDGRGYITHSHVDSRINSAIAEGLIDYIYLKEFSEKEINNIVSETYDSIFIDEYFMIKNNRDFLEAIIKSGRPYYSQPDIYLAGLIADSDARLFDEAIQILPLCDKIEKLNGVCTRCGSMIGNYSYHIGEKESQIEVGDSKYECLCGKCYFFLRGTYD